MLSRGVGFGRRPFVIETRRDVADAVRGDPLQTIAAIVRRLR